MKFTRYIVIAAALVAVSAVVAWFLRDSLIQRLSNPLLQDYGMSIVDVSLDALATRDAAIGYLELAHEKGTTIAIEDLTLPYASASRRSKTFVARKVSVITATRTDGEAFEMAKLIRQVLSLSATLEDSVIMVDEFSLSPYPTVQNVRWEITDNQQLLDGTVGSVSMSAAASRRDTKSHVVSFSILAQPAATGGNTLSAVLTEEEERLMLSGEAQIDLPTWQPLAKLIGIVPTKLEIVSGTATLTFDMTIPDDTSQTPTLAARLMPTSPLSLNYLGADANVASVLIGSADTVEISAAFPDVDWSLGLANAKLAVSYADWRNIPMSLGDVSCKAGPSCSMHTRVAIENGKLPIGRVARVEFSASETVQFLDAGMIIEVQPGSTFRIEELSSDKRGVKRVQAQLASRAMLGLTDSGWRLSADSVDLAVEDFSLADTTSISMPLFLEKVTVANDNDALTFRSGVYAPSSQATWREKTIALPGLKGEMTLQGDNATADLVTVGLHEEAAIKVSHNLGSVTGRASIVDATVWLGKKSLSDRVSPWPDNFDIVAGALSFNMSANWTQEKTGLEFQAQASVLAERLAGYYGDTAFAGFSTEFNAGYRDGAGFHSEPSTLMAKLVDVGVPLNDLSAGYLLDLNTLSADVNDLSMSTFGGVVTADPFSFYTDRPVNTLILNAESLDLTELLSLEGFEAVDVTGSINVRLPLAVEGNTVTIEHGTLTGKPPGGVIRYRSDSPPEAWTTSNWDFVKRVLNNLEYETLTSDVNLSKEGDLIMQVQLKGRNPDLDEKRPVILNLGVENNIPQMLRSLRAARAVEDILERRLSR